MIEHVDWLEKALQNFDEAATWIAERNPDAAQRFALAVRAAIQQVTTLPSSGKPSAVASIREVSVKGFPYVIPYRVIGNRLQVLRVFHVRQLRPENWD